MNNQNVVLTVVILSSIVIVLYATYQPKNDLQPYRLVDASDPPTEYTCAKCMQDAHTNFYKPVHDYCVNLSGRNWTKCGGMLPTLDSNEYAAAFDRRLKYTCHENCGKIG